MEAIASGALILVDHMFVPRPFPLVEGNHIVYYGERVFMDEIVLVLIQLLRCCQTTTTRQIFLRNWTFIAVALRQPDVSP